MNRGWLRNSFVYLILVFAVSALFFTAFPMGGENNRENPAISISTVATDVKEAKVQRISVTEDRLQIEYMDKRRATSQKDASSSLTQQLRDYGVTPEQLQAVNIAYVNPPQFVNWLGILVNLLPVVFFGTILLLMMRQLQGLKLRNEAILAGVYSSFGLGGGSQLPSWGERMAAANVSRVSSLVAQVAGRFDERGLTLAVAESCTGGSLAAAITDRPGVSSFFLGGVVSYANEVKEALLGVPGPVLAEHGAVSEPTARAMAEGVRDRLRADVGVGITGVAGPAGGSAEKPVGLVFIGVAGPGGTTVRRDVWPGSRSEIRAAAVQAALEMIREAADQER